jgi:hypothetical protein
MGEDSCRSVFVLGGQKDVGLCFTGFMSYYGRLIREISSSW